MARTARTERQQLEEAGRTKALLKQLLFTTASDSWDFLYKALLDKLHFELFSPAEWRNLITGQKALTPYKLNWIEQAFPGARKFHDDGPWKIWLALFSPERELWALYHGGNSSIEQAILGFEKRLLTSKNQIEPDDFVEAIAWRRQKLSATPDLSGTVLPLCLIPNSALKSAPPFKSVVPKASACAGLPA